MKVSQTIGDLEGILDYLKDIDKVLSLSVTQEHKHSCPGCKQSKFSLEGRVVYQYRKHARAAYTQIDKLRGFLIRGLNPSEDRESAVRFDEDWTLMTGPTFNEKKKEGWGKSWEEYHRSRPVHNSYGGNCTTENEKKN